MCQFTQLKNNGMKTANQQLILNDNLVLPSVQGKHTTVWGVFRTSSSDCSYFLAFQDEQFHLGSKKEETLTASRGDS